MPHIYVLKLTNQKIEILLKLPQEFLPSTDKISTKNGQSS